MSYGSNEAVEDAEGDHKEKCARLISRKAAELVASRDASRSDAIKQATEWLRHELATHSDHSGVTDMENKEPHASKAPPSAQIAAIAAELLNEARDAADSL
ncbi:hypothetical protein MCEMSEM18_03533 [Comamonadaceae bacterium]